MTQEPSRSGPDLIGDFQRWLVRSGARSVSREVSGQLRSALGRSAGPDVWEKATAIPTDEAPECAWCPFCRAARALRESGPGVTSQMGSAAGAMAGLVHDTLSAFESVVAAARTEQPHTEAEPAPSATVWADVAVQDPGKTAQDPAEAAQDPAEAAQDPGEPAQGLAESAQDPAEAAQEPGEAAQDPAESAQDPAEAAQEPGEAAQGLAESAQDPAEAAQEPGEAAQDPGDRPESTGSPGGPPDEPDDRG